jgi:hypothetical protein
MGPRLLEAEKIIVTNFKKLCWRPIAIALLGPFCISASGSTSELAYFLPGAARALFAVDLESSSVMVGHRVQDASFTITRQANTVESAALTFSIPRGRDRPDSWTFMGVEHKRLGSETIVLGHRKVSVERIGISNDEIRTVLYSSRFGVVGFEVFDGKTLQRIYVAGGCGLFGWHCDRK